MAHHCDNSLPITPPLDCPHFILSSIFNSPHDTSAKSYSSSNGSNHSRNSSTSSVSTLASSISSLSLTSPQFATYGAHLPDPCTPSPPKVTVPIIVLDGPDPLVVDEGPFPPTPRDDHFVPITSSSTPTTPIVTPAHAMKQIMKKRIGVKSFITNEPMFLTRPPVILRKRSNSESNLVLVECIEEEGFNLGMERGRNHTRSPVVNTYHTAPRTFNTNKGDKFDEERSFDNGDKRLCQETRNLLVKGRERRAISKTKSWDELYGFTFEA